MFAARWMEGWKSVGPLDRAASYRQSPRGYRYSRQQTRQIQGFLDEGKEAPEIAAALRVPLYSMRIKIGRMRARPLTAEDDRALIAHVSAGHTLTRIIREMKLSRGEIEKAVARLGLTPHKRVAFGKYAG